MGKKKKKASKPVRTPEKPISVNIFLDGRSFSDSLLSITKKPLHEAMKEVGKNPLNC